MCKRAIWQLSILKLIVFFSVIDVNYLLSDKKENQNSLTKLIHSQNMQWLLELESDEGRSIWTSRFS